MITGVIFTVGGLLAILLAMSMIVFFFIFPELEITLIGLIIQVIITLLLALYMLPRGLLRIRLARAEKVKHESQTR